MANEVTLVAISSKYAIKRRRQNIEQQWHLYLSMRFEGSPWKCSGKFRYLLKELCGCCSGTIIHRLLLFFNGIHELGHASVIMPSG